MDNLLNFPPTNSDISPAYGFCFYYFYFMCYRIQLSSYWVFSFFFAFVFLFYLFYLLCFGRFFSSSPPFPPASSDSVLHGMELVLFWLWMLGFNYVFYYTFHVHYIVVCEFRYIPPFYLSLSNNRCIHIWNLSGKSISCLESLHF